MPCTLRTYIRRVFTLGLSICGAVSTLHAAPDTWAYFGCIDKSAPGIYLATLDSETGALGEPRRLTETAGSSFLAIGPNNQRLYTVATQADADGQILGYQIDPATGDLTAINSASIQSSGACHVCLTPDGTVAATADYGNGMVASFPVAADGSLGEATSVISHIGSSIHPKRQTAPHAHSVIPSPDGRFLYAADLGTDNVYCYNIGAGGALTRHASQAETKVHEGGGPRHFAIHPLGNAAWCNLEMSSEITGFLLNKESGVLTEIERVSTLPEESAEENSTSEILCHPNGKFLYVANRGHNTIAAYTINPESGKLESLSHASCGGEIPRNFGISPDGQWLVTACQESNNSAVLAIDSVTGDLTLTEHQLELPKPMCVRFVPMAQ